jgi:hypothetical protein
MIRLLKKGTSPLGQMRELGAKTFLYLRAQIETYDTRTNLPFY